MPELTIAVRVPWPKHPSLAALEKAIFCALQAAGRGLLLQAFALIEADLLAQGAGARQRRRRRFLITRFGQIRFSRWQTKKDGRFGHPLDEVLSLPARDPCSPWVRATAAWLCQAHPFRQATRLLSKMIGQGIDHRRLWGWTQASGAKLRAAWEQKRSSLFDDGEAPAGAGKGPLIVTTSADGTFIYSRDGPIEVKLGMFWTGAHLQSPTAAHPKFLLDHKGYYASTQNADRFGQTFYVLAEERTGISKAGEVFFVSDGAGWLAALPSDWICPTALQLDHFHGKLRISEVAKDPERAARWWGWVAEHNLDALGRSIHALIHAGRIDPKDAAGLLAYFEKGASALHTYLRLREQGHSAQMAPRGSGAMEHSIDLVVARRFKHQGMRSWSRQGADNLLALRTLAMDPKAWRAWWGDAAV